MFNRSLQAPQPQALPNVTRYIASKVASSCHLCHSQEVAAATDQECGLRAVCLGGSWCWALKPPHFLSDVVVAGEVDGRGDGVAHGTPRRSSRSMPSEELLSGLLACEGTEFY
jgi:hypothetical protein